ncbi:MAG TPA: hypothetical protein VM432_08665 [Bdellovibrionales bacterium]|nr:hypothetical protein [Bdellovibrionales bacterium]
MKYTVEVTVHKSCDEVWKIFSEKGMVTTVTESLPGKLIVGELPVRGSKSLARVSFIPRTKNLTTIRAEKDFRFGAIKEFIMAFLKPSFVKQSRSDFEQFKQYAEAQS